jgi:hypothetical protein
VARASASERPRSPALIREELSPSELKVLRYLPPNLSRPEITSELSLPVNTWPAGTPAFLPAATGRSGPHVSGSLAAQSARMGRLRCN